MMKPAGPIPLKRHAPGMRLADFTSAYLPADRDGEMTGPGAGMNRKFTNRT
ncbi:MAG: hypothetical protein AB2598_12140 [Candidatus Thiodiazotropha sp.]